MSVQYRPCQKCGHKNISPKLGTKQNKRELAEELCRLMGWMCDEAWIIQNRSLSREKLTELIAMLKSRTEPKL